MPLQPLDWLALLHPVLMVLFVYPVVGATIRLGILVRERRLQITEQPAAVPAEHVDHGLWVVSGAVLAVLVALLWSFLAAWSLAGPPPPQRVGLLALAALLALVALAGLRWSGAPGRRALLALTCWGALLVLGAQPEIHRLADDPRRLAFWQSHYWAGMGLTALLLAAAAARAAISRRPWARRLHVALNALVALLLAMQAVSGGRDLLTATPQLTSHPAGGPVPHRIRRPRFRSQQPPPRLVQKL
jgi:hypothetical protein